MRRACHFFYTTEGAIRSVNVMLRGRRHPELTPAQLADMRSGDGERIRAVLAPHYGPSEIRRFLFVCERNSNRVIPQDAADALARFGVLSQ